MQTIETRQLEARAVDRNGPSIGPDRPVVCQLLHGLPVGGAEVLAYRLAQQLGSEFRFVFVCLETLGELGEALRADGFAVHVLDRRPGLDWRCLREIARILRDDRIDLVHAHQYTPFFYATAARWMSTRVPVLFTEHGRHQPDYPRRKRMLFNRLALRRDDRVIAVGENVRQALIANEGLSPRRVDVIYNGVDLGAFAADSSARLAPRTEIGLAPEAFVIAQVARLDYLKDHLTAIRALARVVAEHSRARLVLVGEGPERPRIEAEIARLGLESHVRLLGLRRDVGRILAAADAFLLTSLSEGIPLTLIEAMAARLPVVSTNVGGVPEVVVAEETGLLAAAGDDAALANALLRLARDPALRRQLGEAGCRRARARFSEETMHARYRHLYHDMTRARHS